MNARTISAVAIFGIAVAGYVTLAIVAPDQDYRGLLTFASIGAAWLGLSGNTSAIKRSVARVEKQTNGVLDQRIKDGVTSVLKEHGLIKPEAEPTPPAIVPKKRAIRKPRIVKGIN